MESCRDPLRWSLQVDLSLNGIQGEIDLVSEFHKESIHGIPYCSLTAAIKMWILVTGAKPRRPRRRSHDSELRMSCGSK